MTFVLSVSLIYTVPLSVVLTSRLHTKQGTTILEIKFWTIKMASADEELIRCFWWESTIITDWSLSASDVKPDNSITPMRVGSVALTLAEHFTLFHKWRPLQAPCELASKRSNVTGHSKVDTNNTATVMASYGR